MDKNRWIKIDRREEKKKITGKDDGRKKSWKEKRFKKG